MTACGTELICVKRTWLEQERAAAQGHALSNVLIMHQYAANVSS